MLALGYKVPATRFEPSELLRLGCLAETVGFDSVFVDDCFQNQEGEHACYAFGWLGALSAKTSRVLIGTSLVAPIYRHHPAIVAQAAATLATMCDNRFLLGLGIGHVSNDVSAIGIGSPTLKERQGRLREATQLIRRLLTEERVTFRERYYRTENATIYDRPADDLRIYIAAGDAITATIAGELADGLICESGEGDAFYERTLIPNFKEGIRLSGRRNDSLGRILEINVSLDADLDKAKTATLNWPALSVVEASHSQSTAASTGRWIVSSDPEEHVHNISKYIEMGFFHLVFNGAGRNQEHFLRAYADQVLPRLRKQFGGLQGNRL